MKTSKQLKINKKKLVVAAILTELAVNKVIVPYARKIAKLK